MIVSASAGDTTAAGFASAAIVMIASPFGRDVALCKAGTWAVYRKLLLERIGSGFRVGEKAW